MVAALGNGDLIRTSFATMLKIKCNGHTFTMFCYVFQKLKFLVIMGNKILYERLAIVVYEDLSTYIMDDEGERVHLNE